MHSNPNHNARTSFAISFKNRAALIVAFDRPPCFQAFRFPIGAPGLVPPCILHRRYPFTAGKLKVRFRRYGVITPKSEMLWKAVIR